MSRRWRAHTYWALATLYAIGIVGAPLLGAAALFGSLQRALPTPVALALTAPCALVLYALVPALLCVPHRRWIVPAKMQTDVGIRAYFHRRLYGLCWSSLYYHPIAYWLVLTLPLLRAIVFRLFGYRGSLRFTVYPDTWIRDLPLLRIGAGAYLSNKATLGTNMILANRQIVVDAIEVGAGATVGHLACVGLGTVCEPHSEIGVGALVGMRCRIGESARIGPAAILDHGARVGARANVQVAALIGSATVLAPELYVGYGRVVRARARVHSQGDLDATVERGAD